LLNASALVLAVVFVVPLKLTGSCGPRYDVPSSITILGLAGTGLVWVLLSRKGGPVRAKMYWSVSAGVLSLAILIMPPIPVLEGYSTC